MFLEQAGCCPWLRYLEKLHLCIHEHTHKLARYDETVAAMYMMQILSCTLMPPMALEQMTQIVIRAALSLLFLQGDLGSRRAKYEARWHSFAAADKSKAIHMADVPWLVDDLNEDPVQLASFVLYGAVTSEEQRKRSRGELMRWHPDKFVSRFGSRLYLRDKTSILDKVNAISQLLNTIHAGI